MGLSTVFRVFKNASLVTGQGEFKISRVFPTIKAAIRARYYFYASGNGTDIFSRRTRRGRKFAVIGD